MLHNIIKSIFLKRLLHCSHTICSKKYIDQEVQLQKKNNKKIVLKILRKVPWIPNIGAKLRHEFEKVGP